MVKLGLVYGETLRFSLPSLYIVQQNHGLFVVLCCGVKVKGPVHVKKLNDHYIKSAYCKNQCL